MDKAKAAVGSYLHKDGKHDTTVHETVNPAVTQENVTRTQHENVTTAVDREVHQDHHHTSVQPLLVLSEIPNTPLLPIQPLLASTSTTTSMKTSNLYLRRRPFSPLSSTLLCPFMRCTRTRQSTTPPPLSAVTMDEFKKQGGHLSGRDERTDAFAGEPRSV